MTDTPFSDENQQASDFAAAILMPTNAFLLAAKKLQNDPIKLAMHFRVPLGAVHRRAAMLNLSWAKHINADNGRCTHMTDTTTQAVTAQRLTMMADATLLIDPNGYLVWFSDYAALLAERDALAAQLATARGALETAQHCIATFIGVHGYPIDSSEGEQLAEVDAALRALTKGGK